VKFAGTVIIVTGQQYITLRPKYNQDVIATVWTE